MKRFLLVAVLLPLAALSARAQLAVRADTLYPVTEPRITNGIVLIGDGEIQQVGSASEVQVPEDYRMLKASVVTPGLVDAHSVVGLSGIYNRDADQDQLDRSAPIQPELRAIDAYNVREELVRFLRQMGVTTIHTGHGPGALVSGQTMTVKTSGENLAEALVDTTTMLAMTIGPSVEQNFDSPGTRPKGVAMLRQKLIEAQTYRRKQASENPPPRDLGLEVLSRLLEGEVPALITAQQVPSIMAALRLAEEFDFPLVLDGGAEVYQVLDEIRASDVPVILHPTMVRPHGATRNAAFTTAGKLDSMGIPFSMQSGYEAYVPKTRVVLFEAAVAAANGLPRNEALKAITIDAARILGIDDRVGSLESGKDADLVLFDGDPFQYTSRACKVIIDGAVVSRECR